MKLFRRLDFIIMAAVLVMALVVLAVMWATVDDGEPVVNIYINGDLIDTFPLSSDTPVLLPIDTVYGHNTVAIEEGRVWIDHADCENQNCVAQGAIDRMGGLIVCAPHRLVIRIEGMDGDGLDGVTY